MRQQLFLLEVAILVLCSIGYSLAFHTNNKLINNRNKENYIGRSSSSVSVTQYKRVPPIVFKNYYSGKHRVESVKILPGSIPILNYSYKINHPPNRGKVNFETSTTRVNMQETKRPDSFDFGSIIFPSFNPTKPNVRIPSTTEMAQISDCKTAKTTEKEIKITSTTSSPSKPDKKEDDLDEWLKYWGNIKESDKDEILDY